MPTTRKGQKVIRIILDEGSEIETTLLEWAEKRGLRPGKAGRCILADWADAMNGKPNPFALAIAATAGGSSATNPLVQSNTQAPEPAMSAEEKARQEALLLAAEQFL